MTQIAFFGHDIADAAIQRRIHAMRADGCKVAPYMMWRDDRDRRSANEGFTDLGRTYAGRFRHRIGAIFEGARRAARREADLRAADLIYARNLDMLACAFLVKRRLNLSTPVIYECLDVHRLMVRRDPIGWGLRSLEGALLKRCCLLVVSSPAFLKHYFKRYHSGSYKAFLLENRLSDGDDYGARPNGMLKEDDGKLRLGWVGILRCQRSFSLLCAAADKFGERLSIELYGKPALNEVPEFHEKVAERPNMHDHGPYRSPNDLSGIYATLDAVWAGDFMEAGYNSAWLLPNRIYEGGYYNVPAIAPADSETGNWVATHTSGICLPEPLEQTFPDLIEALISQPGALTAPRRNLSALADDVFVQPKGFVGEMVRSALAGAPI